MKLKRSLIILLTIAMVSCAVILCACVNTRDPLNGKYVVQFRFNGGSLNVGTTDVNDNSQFGYAYDEAGHLIVDPVSKYSTPGTTDAIKKLGYDFTGWYKDEACSESEKWNFSQDRLNDEKLVLYAGWKSQVQYTYSLHYAEKQTDGTFKDVTFKTYNTSQGRRVNVTTYTKYANERKGFTALGLYSDSACTKEWDENFAHPGGETLDVPVYVKYIEGEWTVVKTFSQLNSAASGNKNVYLMNDIDCKGAEFRFEICNYVFEGNGHTVSNFTVNTRGASGLYLFASLGEKAELRNVTFKNVTYDITEAALPSIKLAVIANTAQATSKISNVKITGTVDSHKPDLNIDNLVGNEPKLIFEDSGSQIENVSCELTVKQTER